MRLRATTDDERCGSEAMIRADDVISLLALEPHPEGGHFRQTFRDERCDGAGRAASTAIYFLLSAGEVSAWHRVDAVEVWHWYAGDPLTLSIAERPGKSFDVELGADLGAGQRPQAVVPRFAWQQARSRGAWTLVGCTVAPGFEFDGFEMAPRDFDPRR